ncbi:MAG: PAS domain-containing protein [Pseudomonadota bacterium]
MAVDAKAYGFQEDASEAVRHLSAHLDSLRDGRSMPPKSKLFPEELPPSLLPGLFVVQVLGDEGPGSTGPWQLRYRLVGTHIVDASGIDWTGQELGPALLENRWQSYREAYEAPLRTRQPTCHRHDFRNLSEDRSYPSRRYLFPLCDSQERITLLVGFFVIESGAWRFG